MTDQQKQTLDAALAGLSDLDRFDVIERLVLDLRTAFAPGGPQPDFDRLEQFVYALRWAVAPDRPRPEGEADPESEEEFDRLLIRSGMMIRRPEPPGPDYRPDFEPIELEGEPLSEQIIRERR